MDFPLRNAAYSSTLVAAAVFFLPTLLAGSAQAHQKIADTFSPSQSYDPGAGENVLGPLDPFGPVQIAEAFTPAGSDYTLDFIDGAFSHIKAYPNINGANAITLTLQTSNMNGVPSGNALEIWTLTDLPQFPHGGPIATASSLLHPVLKGGETYWVVASPGDETASMVWNSNVMDSVGPVSYNLYGYWQTQQNPVGAFDVYASPLAPAVPEPATTVPFVLGALGIGVLVVTAKRKKQNA
ncbi:MAG: PEP-CTERM sorting domain-containing protein [Ktedonobacteraceae bacterium]|nr:PEP-CTERM sorting domain-containing protein [Ktedonobacteraceae bacterium]